MNCRRILVPAMLAVITAIAGCGSGGDPGRKPTYKVTGKVTLAGAPVAGATVTFYPAENQRAPTGQTDENGEYVMSTYEYGDGAMEGQYGIAVFKAVMKKDNSSAEGDHEAIASGQADPGAGHAASDDDEASASAVPMRYTNPDDSGFSANVTPDGENRFDLEMQP